MENNKENERHMARRAEHYKAADINGKLIINLRDMSHIMRFLYEGRGSQKRILIILNEAGVITQRELTERIGVRPGSASEVISKLESAGYIARTPSETDRRTTDITLTESGKAAALEAAQRRDRRHEEMFSCLSADEKKTLLALLEKVNIDWDSRYRIREERHGHHEHCKKERR